MFDRACELGLLISSADLISKLFGMHITIRIFEVLLHDGSSLTEWTTSQLHALLIKEYHLSPEDYKA